MCYHHDYDYSLKDCKFDTRINPQLKDTPTVVYTLGDSRTLNWKRRHVAKKKSTNNDNSGEICNVWSNGK